MLVITSCICTQILNIINRNQKFSKAPNIPSPISKKFIFKISKLSNEQRYIPRHLIFVSFVAFLILIIKRDKLSEYVNENSTLQLVFSCDMLRYEKDEVMGKVYNMIFGGMLFLSYIYFVRFIGSKARSLSYHGLSISNCNNIFMGAFETLSQCLTPTCEYIPT